MRRRVVGFLGALVLLASVDAGRAVAQSAELRVTGTPAPVAPIPIDARRGFAAVPWDALERLGWTVGAASVGPAPAPVPAGAAPVAGGTARRGADSVTVREGSPFFTWGAQLLQMADAPFRAEDRLWVPLQLVTDFLPAHLPDAYAFRAKDMTLDASPAGSRASAAAPAAAAPKPQAAAPAPKAAPAAKPQAPQAAPAAAPGPQSAPAAAPGPSKADPRARPSTVAAKPAEVASGKASASQRRVVVIDPGHGGSDPGARGPGGAREKDIALALGLALARELEKRPDLEVHLTRADDRLVPLWERGEWATEIKADRPGIFISLHLNAGAALDARGFETYFLSEARTEHERRVAALENEAFDLGGRPAATRDQALSGILKELSNLDHQHWSAELAEMVQSELAPIHPGPDRGVKQGPLAVITNALMPAVLVEVGFISNASESKLLSGADFQADAARAIARSVDRFFEVYPPGAAAGAGAR